MHVLSLGLRHRDGHAKCRCRVATCLELLCLHILRLHADKVKEIDEHLGFNLDVKRCLNIERWAKVHFKEPWFKLIVKQHIKAKKLETVGGMGWL